MTKVDKSAKAETALSSLIGLQIRKAWNVFATRFFYFGKPHSENYDGEVWLELECPWRIENSEEILVGSDDYGERAEGNSDPNWDPREDQTGHLQDERLQSLLGELRDGAVFNRTAEFVVESVRADALGGFRLFLSRGYVLSVFPAATSGLQWLLSYPAGRNFSLMDGRLSGSLVESE